MLDHNLASSYSPVLALDAVLQEQSNQIIVEPFLPLTLTFCVCHQRLGLHYLFWQEQPIVEFQ